MGDLGDEKATRAGGATRRSGVRQAPSPRLAGAVAGVGCLLCVGLLHLAPQRPWAAAIVPVVAAWGTFVVLRAGSAPPLPWLLGTAALLRLLPVGSPPLLSDDLYRYLWEGFAWAQGHAPLYASPASLAALDPELAARVTHAELPSVYPPLAMAWFRLLAAVATEPWSVQLGTALADLVTVGALATFDRRAAWLWALLPVAVLEAGAGAHIDIPAIAFATVGLALWHRAPAWAGVAWAAGALVKLFPVVLLPLLWRRLTTGQLAAWLALVGAATTLAALPHLQGQVPPGLVAYGNHWSFNGFAFPFLHPVLGTATRPLLLVAGGAWALRAWWRHRSPPEVWAAIGTAFVLLSPTVHPWYVLWAALPDVACGRRGWALAAVALSGSYLVLLAYDPTSGRWAEAPWLWWVTWMPALVALGWGYARSEASPTAP